MGISQYRLAKDSNVPPRRINEIVHGKKSVTADTALRFGKFFNMTPQFWMDRQSRYDLEMAEDRLKERLDCYEPLKAVCLKNIAHLKVVITCEILSIVPLVYPLSPALEYTFLSPFHQRRQ